MMYWYFSSKIDIKERSAFVWHAPSCASAVRTVSWQVDKLELGNGWPVSFTIAWLKKSGAYLMQHVSNQVVTGRLVWVKKEWQVERRGELPVRLPFAH
jgi:hypothetical protein